MNIASTQYSLQYKSFEIYLSGCNGSCQDCCNPELKNFNIGEKITKVKFTQITSKIQEFDKLIDKIWILGGDPLDNNLEELQLFLNVLKWTTNKEIWLWTRYSLNNIPQFIKKHCAYIKCGEYKPEFKTDDNIKYNIKLATSNQTIYKKGLDY